MTAAALPAPVVKDHPDDGTWTATLDDAPEVRLMSTRSGHAYRTCWVCQVCRAYGDDPGNYLSPAMIERARTHAASHRAND